MVGRIDAAYRSAEMRCTARIEDRAIEQSRGLDRSRACIDRMRGHFRRYSSAVFAGSVR
jgi:hypothetical protein